MFTKNLEIRHLVLLGLMGAGKTTVGRLLAQRLGWPLDDSDLSIQRRCGATVRELSERLGVGGMHQLEAEHLLAALAAEQRSVVCAAASVVESPECQRALGEDGVFAVWLRADVETLVAHFTAGPHRPVLDADTEKLFRRQLAERGRRFSELARLSVDVHPGSPERTAAEIVDALPG